MLLKSSAVKIFKTQPIQSNVCPECGEPQVLKWDSVGGGRNVILTSSTHDECYKKYYKNIVAVKESRVQGVA